MSLSAKQGFCMTAKKRVLIVGGGFAGLAVARSLKRGAFDVTLLDRNNYHLFQPLLYQVATGALSGSDIAAPIRTILKPHTARVLQEEVRGIDVANRTIVTVSGNEYRWDILVLALGLGHSYFGNDQWVPFAPGLKFLGDAMVLRDRILGALEKAETTRDPEQRERLTRFVVVGGGPTGVELAGAIGELTHKSRASEFVSYDPSLTDVLLVEGGPRILPQYSPENAANAGVRLGKIGVRVLVSSKVVDVDAGGVTLEDSSGARQRIEAANVIWAAGAAVTPLGADIARQLGVKPVSGGRLPVDENFRLQGHENLYVIGDLAAYRLGDTQLPGLGPAAEQAGRFVGTIINGSTGAFRYRERGHLAVIGRNAAVGILFGRRVTGPLAWWAWLLVHIYGLIGLDAKIRVLIVWAWKFWFGKYSARIILESAAPLDTETR